MRETRNLEKFRITPGRALLAGIALGLTGVVIATHLDWRRERPPSPLRSGEHSSSGASVSRLEQLADALETEVKARTELAARIRDLETEIAMLSRTHQEATKNPRALGDSKIASEDLTAPADLGTGAAASNFDEKALLARGVHPRDVARLRDLWESHELERAEIADRALREGWFLKARHRIELTQLDRELREKIPDEEYDRYLYALGRPNRLKAGEILHGSTASDAGLQRGDFILSYDGLRVFSPGELLLASSQGEPGHSVRVEILRDGETRIVHVRRGPLGVMIEHSRGEPLRD